MRNECFNICLKKYSSIKYLGNWEEKRLFNRVKMFRSINTCKKLRLKLGI